MDSITAANALRALLVEAAKVPRLEAENAHLRKRVAIEPAAEELRAELDAIKTALAAATAGIVSAWRDLMAIGAAADAFHRDVGAEPGSLTPAQIIAAAATHYLNAEHLCSERAAITAALAESPVPCPPDCDIAEWIRYACREWLMEREENNEDARLLAEANSALTTAGIPLSGTLAERIGVLARERDQYAEEVRRQLFGPAPVRAPAEPELGHGDLPFSPADRWVRSGDK